MFDLRKYITEANDTFNETKVLPSTFSRNDITLLGDKLRVANSQSDRRKIKDLMARLKSGPGPFTKNDVDLVYHLASTTYAAGTSDQLHDLKRRLEASV